MKRSPRRSRNILAGAAATLLLVAAACDRYYFESRPVSLQITVVVGNGNPRSGIVVRIVKAWNEWSNDVREGKEPWSKLTTDARGRAFFDSEAIALAELGFRERPRDRAILSFDSSRNEAEFTIEVGTATRGFTEHEIGVRFRDAHVDAEIEFVN